MGFFHSVKHEFHHAAHAVEHEIKKTGHEFLSEAEKVGETVEHGVEEGVSKGVGLVGKTISGAVSEGTQIAGTAENWMAKAGGSAFSTLESGAEDVLKGGASLLGPLDPFNWGTTTWLLIGGGVILVGYLIYRAAPTPESIGRRMGQVTRVAGQVGERVAPLVLA
jgi:hypothetical protein